MEPTDLSAGKLMYEAEIRFTETVDYGVSMADLTSGTRSIPRGGARFDQTFEGTLNGPVLKGRISGTDYLTVRADGLFQLHLHGQVTTEDGTTISMSSKGMSMQMEGERCSQLRSAVCLYTVSETFGWLNRLQLWAVGTFDPVNGEAVIRAYAL